MRSLAMHDALMHSFRMATLADLPDMTRIENACGYSHWSESQLHDSIMGHQVYLAGLVADKPDALIPAPVSGFAIFNSVLDETELLNIAIAPQWQGKGIGKALLLHCLQLLQQQGIRQCFLEVGVSNNTAIQMYQKCGFNTIAIRKNYYQHANTTEDAMVMQLQLEEMPCKN